MVQSPTEVVEDLLYQFAYRTKKGSALALTTGGLSALEGGFYFLGWNDPHLIPENECDEEGCSNEATCGTPTKLGYRRVCGEHYRKLTK